MTQVCTIPLTSRSDNRGLLVAAEFPREIPFVATRTFLIMSPFVGNIRGEHAHKSCHQFLIAARGAIEVEWDDDLGTDKIVLDNPSIGLHIPPLAWAKQQYLSSDAILMVMASHAYDLDDYIDDREVARRKRVKKF